MKELIKTASGQDYEPLIKNLLSSVVENNLIPLMNSPRAIDDLLTNLGSNLICLSLAECPYSSPMWAHYAGNSTGFAIAFDTSNAFFRRGDQGGQSGLYQIRYLDGRLGEILDDPYAALISKTTEWSYEKEWRLYIKKEMATKTIICDNEEVQLIAFPRDLVQRVILGLHATAVFEQDMRAVLSANYPGVGLYRLQANRLTATMNEVPVKSASGLGCAYNFDSRKIQLQFLHRVSHIAHILLEDRHCPSPPCRRSADLHREARHGKARRRQHF